MDGALIYAGLYFISHYWEVAVKAGEGLHYPLEFYLFVIPAYVFIWLTSIHFAGGYDKPIKLVNIVRGLIVRVGSYLNRPYGLMSEEVRFSRAVILVGSLWALIAIPAVRLLFHGLKWEGFSLTSEKTKRFLVVGKSR